MLNIANTFIAFHRNFGEIREYHRRFIRAASWFINIFSRNDYIALTIEPAHENTSTAFTTPQRTF
jgi:hypothetical protein